MMAHPDGRIVKGVDGRDYIYKDGVPYLYSPVGGGSADWDGIAGKPAVIAAGANGDEARTVIGAASQADQDALEGRVLALESV